MPSKIKEVEYIDRDDAEEAERLCGAISELLKNWMLNNADEDGGYDPFIVLMALGRCINHTIGPADCPHCRKQAATAVIDLILNKSRVNGPEVMQMVGMLNHRPVGRKLDA